MHVKIDGGTTSFDEGDSQLRGRTGTSNTWIFLNKCNYISQLTVIKNMCVLVCVLLFHVL